MSLTFLLSRSGFDRNVKALARTHLVKPADLFRANLELERTTQHPHGESQCRRQRLKVREMSQGQKRECP